MKTVTLSFFIVALSSLCSGLKDISSTAEFLPCQTAESLNTLWPDFTDPAAFFKCAFINEYTRYVCPAPLLFKFEYQVCVWEWQWLPPPPPEEITPFPPTDGTSTISTITTTSGATNPTFPTLPSDPPPTVELVIILDYHLIIL
jgi:hypothetical protein